MLGDIIAPFHPQRPHGGEPAEADARGGPQKRPHHVGAINVAGIEKHGAHEDQLLLHREAIFGVQLDELIAADALIGGRIPGTDISIFKAADAVNTAQIELLINWHLAPIQALHIAHPGMDDAHSAPL